MHSDPRHPSRCPLQFPRGLGQRQRLDPFIPHIYANHGDTERSEGHVMSDDP